MGKQGSVIFTDQLCSRIRNRCQPQSNEFQRAINEAERFLAMSDDELREQMFSPSLKRSYHVFSDGYCPTCKGNVPLHNWRMDVIRHPWKMICPLCGDLFPKNDFYRFYKSGLDGEGNFQYALADRSLLHAEEDIAGPEGGQDRNSYGIDDGNGCVIAGDTWYFIAHYLLFGQWMQVVLEGIRCLSRAYVVTGERNYARKAIVLLHRVADVFPDFDFKQQGLIYEKEHNDVGYISYYFRTCTDLCDMALAYDMIYSAFIGEDAYAESLRHIEERIFYDAIANRQKYESNFPMTDTTICLIKTILSWPDNKEEIERLIADITTRATAVDGLTGERGLVVYSAYAFFDYAHLLSYYELIAPGFLADRIARHPLIYDAYRFFIDTWCLQSYYPRIGNTGAFAKPDEQYAVYYYNDDFFQSYLDPDLDLFLWKLYEITGDADFAKAVWISRGGRSDLCFTKSVLTDHVEQLQGALEQLISETGPYLDQKSINKQEWKLAVVHAGCGSDKRAIWMKYDSGGDHGHYDGMNIGIFAKGLDLMPDFGYPPVQYGRFTDRNEYPWYYRSAAHNTVVVDGKDHKSYAGLIPCMGESKIWETGSRVKVIQADAPELIDGTLFERTIICIDLSESDSYYLDLFRVKGGREHVKFIRSTMGELSVHGLQFGPSDGIGYEGLMMRNVEVSQSAPAPGWRATWKIDDSHFQVRNEPAPVFFKYIDLTDDATVFTAESWVDLWPKGNYKNATETVDMWIPTVIVRRDVQEERGSRFIGIYEPYDAESQIAAACKRFDTDNEILLEITLSHGQKDLILFRTSADSITDFGEMETDAEILFMRVGDGAVQHFTMINGSYVSFGEERLYEGANRAFLEWDLADKL